MAERVELVSPFAVQFEGESEPTWVSRDNVQELWGRLSAEQKAHNQQRGNVKVSEQSPAEEAFAKEAARDKTLDDVTAAGKTPAGKPQPRRGGTEV